MQIPLKVFLSYAHEDEALKKRLDIHLTSLKRSGKIETWSDHMIAGGEEWDDAIKIELDRADLILLLVSADFLASEYIWKIELTEAMEKHKSKEAIVIPIFLKPCDWKDMPFAPLQGLPKDSVAVTEYEDRELAFLHIATGLRKVVEIIETRK